MRLKNINFTLSRSGEMVGLVIFMLSLFVPRTAAQTGPQPTADEAQLVQIEAKYAKLIEQDRTRKILSTRTAHDKKFDLQTHTETGIREFLNGLNEVYSLEEIQTGLSELIGKQNRTTGKPYAFDQKALNLKGVLYGQGDRMTWREEVVVIWFQSKHDIDEQGDVGPKTWAKFRELEKEKELARLQVVPQEVRQALPPKAEVPEIAPLAPKLEEPKREASIPPPEILPPPSPPPAATVPPMPALKKTDLVTVAVETLDTTIIGNATLLSQLTMRLAKPEYKSNLEELSRARRLLDEQDQLLKDLKTRTSRARAHQETIAEEDPASLQKAIAELREDIKTRENSIFEAYQILIRAEERWRQVSLGP